MYQLWNYVFHLLYINQHIYPAILSHLNTIKYLHATQERFSQSIRESPILRIAINSFTKPLIFSIYFTAMVCSINYSIAK